MTGSAVPPHILALNGSPEVLELFAELLEEEGYRVTTQPYTTRDFPAIVDMAPDLIILDYMWATDDSGWSLLQMLKMKPSTQAIPIVLCTGAVTQVESLKPRLDEMRVKVVLKPFNIDDLLQTISSALEGATLSS